MLWVQSSTSDIYIVAAKDHNCVNVNVNVLDCTIVFPAVILLCLYRESQPHKTQKAPHHKPKTSSTENSNPKNPIQDPNPKTPNAKPPLMSKMRKILKNNPGKKYSSYIVQNYNKGSLLTIKLPRSTEDDNFRLFCFYTCKLSQ